MPRYLVVGRLGLELDADPPMQVGDVTIGKEPPRAVKKSPAPTITSTFDADVVATPPSLTIRTSTYLWCHVVADSALDAIGRARREELVALRHAVSRTRGRVVDAEFTWAYPEDGQPGSGDASAAVRVVPLRPEPLIGVDVMDADYRAVVSEDRCRIACNYLERARALTGAAYLGPPAGDAAVLEYAKALEYLATDSRLARPVDQRAQQQDEEVRSLSRKLEAARSAKQRVKAVMSSADNLRRLDRKFTDQRITAMREVLSLSPAWLTVAQRLFSARNRKAAHPGQYLSEDDRRLLLHGHTDGKPIWSASADWMVSEAISVFARHVDSP